MNELRAIASEADIFTMMNPAVCRASPPARIEQPTKSGLFTLLWIRFDGCATAIEYTYDGYGTQAGYSRAGWIRRCIAFGKAQGLRYAGMKKGNG